MCSIDTIRHSDSHVKPNLVCATVTSMHGGFVEITRVKLTVDPEEYNHSGKLKPASWPNHSACVNKADYFFCPILGSL